ncbi:MAG: translocation protein TolB, partial [Myxococcota bacterium]
LTGEAGIFSTRIAYVKRTKTGKAVFVSDVDGSDPERVTPADTLSLLPTWDTSGRYLLFTSYMKSNPDLFRLELASEQLEWLSSKRGLNTGAAVSPDGKHIALTLSLDGNTEIYVMDWDGNNLRRLTDSWGQDVSPTWSPDGKRIAFVSSRSGNPHIYIINADGTAPRRLTFQGNYNQEPDWSPRADGQIAFTARDEFLKYDIFLVHPDSGEISRLTQDEGNNESPSFSPDGHQLAFTSTRDAGGKQIYIMNVDGSSQRRITRQAGEFETPAWGPRLGYEGK